MQGSKQSERYHENHVEESPAHIEFHGVGSNEEYTPKSLSYSLSLDSDHVDVIENKPAPTQAKQEISTVISVEYAAFESQIAGTGKQSTTKNNNKQVYDSSENA